MNATTTPYGRCYISDARPSNVIKFRDPRDQTVTITGVIFTMSAGDNARSRVRAFTLYGHDRVFTVSCNYHISILA